MEGKIIEFVVYGAEVKCASCVNAPGSKETYEWLQAAISRKYEDDRIQYTYIDIHDDQSKADQNIIQKILDDELFYPLVLIEDEVVAEGNIRLKTVYRALEDQGLLLKEND